MPASCRQIVLPYPVISDNDLAKIVHINDEGNLPGFASHVVDGRYDPRGGGEGLRARLAAICAEVSAAIEVGARLIILSDRGTGVSGGPVPPKGGLGGKVPPGAGGSWRRSSSRATESRSRRCC